jgi:2-desacetyl-2-hydroxyethyl bacteriochlorophyllide A dehydrogenase
VLVRSTYSGISTGTDKWVLQGRFTWHDFRFPLVPGYQRAGVVEAIGRSVTSVRPGDRVVALFSRDFDGHSAAWGGHTALGVSPESEVYAADGVDPLAASLVVSAQVGFNAASRLTLGPGSRVVVFGDGVIGSSAALAARARGFEPLLVGRHQERLAASSRVGIETIESRQLGVGDLERLHPAGVIDTVQSMDAFASYVDALEPARGQIVYSGHSPDGVTAWADMTVLQQRELTTHFVSGWTRPRIEATLGLMRDGRFPVEALVGAVAGDAVEVDELMAAVIAGSLVPTAAVIDWTALG